MSVDMTPLLFDGLKIKIQMTDGNEISTDRGDSAMMRVGQFIEYKSLQYRCFPYTCVTYDDNFFCIHFIL